MPTVNQLIRKGRKPIRKKSGAPATPAIHSKHPKKGQTPRTEAAPKKRGVCVRVSAITPKKPEFRIAKGGQG